MPNPNLNNLDNPCQKIIKFYEESIIKIRELDRQGNQGQVREEKGKQLPATIGVVAKVILSQHNM